MHLVDDDIVISGIGGHFPKSNNVEEFQNNLFSNQSLIGSRWPDGELGVTNALGTMKKSNSFDYIYFRILRQQSFYMDPMHCMALERTYEALIDAGINPIELKGKRVGCFMGSAVGEEDNLYVEGTASGYGITGHCRAMLPNRISYWLDIKGPSINYYLNWVSGIEVLRAAYDAIKEGHCDSAIVGTTNFAMTAKFNWIYSDMNLLSPDGVTRPFDANANGYARSDGIIVMYIQRASDARRSYASIVNVATYFDGNSEGPLLHVDTHYLTNFIRDFYKDSEVKPEDVDFVETYGCGLQEIDKIELEALEKIYCKNRKEPLKIGAVKANAGHAEASASLISVIKVLIAMETETIPATINHNNSNPEIPQLHNGSMEVITDNKKWTGQYAAVNALGIDSYYGHVLLKANPKKKTQCRDEIPRLIVASTRTEEGIRAIIETIKNRPCIDEEYINLIQEFFSKPIAQHVYRGYIVQGSLTGIKEESRSFQGNKAPIWFVYSGMGSQWNGMIGDFMKIPIFAQAINECHDILLKKDVNLLEILTSDDPKVFDNILHCFVGIAAIQIALTNILKALEIVPDGIIGHSVGELGCAYADECVTAEQMILAAYYRGRASLEATLIKGMMAAVGIGYNKMKDMVPPTIEVACHNGPDSCTISGPKEDMEIFVRELQAKGIFARLVNVANIAYHSQYIKPAAPILLKYLKEVLPVPVTRSAKWISTSNKEQDWNTDLSRHSSAEYHTNNLLSSVLFEEGLKHIPKNAILIEIAPHGLLQAILKRSCKLGCINVPLTQRSVESPTEFLLIAVGKLYLAGITMKISNLYPKVKYPVSKGTPSLANLSHWEHTNIWDNAIDELKNPPGAIDLQGTLNSTEFRSSLNHQINNSFIVPCSTFLKILFDITERIKCGRTQFVFENLSFIKPLIISSSESTTVHAMVHKGSGHFEIVSGTEIFVTGTMTFPNSGENFMIDPIKINVDKNSIALSEKDIYSEFQHRGHKYDGPYKKLKYYMADKMGSIGTVQWNNEWMELLEAIIQQHLLHDGEQTQEALLPKSIIKITVDLNALPANDSKLTVYHNFTTNIMTTTGICIEGLQPQLAEKNQDAILVDSIEFVPLKNTSNLKIENALFNIIQLIFNNFKIQNRSNINVTEIQTKNNSLMKNIENVLQTIPNINIKILRVKTVHSISVKSAVPELIVFNDILTEELAHFISQSDGFLLLRTNESILSHPEIIEIFQFSLNEISYSLLRKSNNLEPIYISVNENTLSSLDLSNKSISWVKEMDKLVSNKSQKSLIILVAKSLPFDGVYEFLQNLNNMTSIHSIRLIFLLNSKLDKNGQILKQILKQNLNIMVLQNDVIGTILPIPSKLKKVNFLNKPTNNDLNIDVIGLNFNNSILESYLDYSGVEKGKSVMGLGVLDKNSSKVLADPILKWDVPEYWSMENAASFPAAYINAYYCLVIKGKIKPGDSVFISGGCTPMGLAVISIASYYECSIYTTALSKIQKTYLMYNYERLKERNIFSNECENLEPLLMEATNGLGLNVIINEQPGDFIETTYRCLAKYGRFIQIDNFSNYEQIGMKMFADSIAFSVVNLRSFYKLSNPIKERIKQLIDEGIRLFIVRPIKSKTVKNIDIEQVQENMVADKIGKLLIQATPDFPLKQILVTKSLQHICNKNSSYLVYGDCDQWCDLVEWLVLRGANKIVVAIRSEPKEVYIHRRLNIFQSIYKANISFIQPTAINRIAAAELLTNVNMSGPIYGVFVLPHKENHFINIDHALRTISPKAVIVNFNANVTGSSLANFNGLLSYQVQWKNNLSFNEVVSCLDEILKYNIGNSYIKSNVLASQQTDLAIVQSLDQILPSIDDLIDNEIVEASREPDFIQLVTLGIKEIRELPPIFIIPGLSGQQELLDLSHNLIYPVFCAVLPARPLKLKEIAQHLVTKMKTIYAGNVYNIIGLSWGGALMIEIARLLDNDGASLHLFFIDSAPDSLKSAINHLGNQNDEIEVNLLSRVFKIDNSNLISNLSTLSNWNQRLDSVLQFHNVNENNVKEALNVLKNNIYELKNFKATEKLVSGRIHLIRPQNCSKYDNCGLVSYCQEIPQITLVDGNHLSIIKNEITNKYISENHHVI